MTSGGFAIIAFGLGMALCVMVYETTVPVELITVVAFVGALVIGWTAQSIAHSCETGR